MLTLFAVAAGLELIGVAFDVAVLQWVAKPLLAPLLAIYLLRRRGFGPVVVALGFATAGDVALLIDDERAFLVGMAFFLGTQACLISVFTRRGRLRRGALAGYAVLWAGANAALWERLGDLRVPVLVYSLALSVMAATAAGISRRVAAGGALFLVSDFLIGLGAADITVPGQDLLVMVTYIAALALIVTGWARLDPDAELGKPQS
ncbi:lysoplasmalogenase [Cryptosporangium arvum]|uniref:Putative membrane protein n=1 Tax=Cryptosporangium arvum DSM 44712 TaxID=927661 RepID=A0A010YRQ1_9ACTN|nr:lysoplasmalogenase [Cryptosporangium arvum]EXG82895.1 putative membrane protein [Cryptosporangium arvum DSM 44712]